MVLIRSNWRFVPVSAGLYFAIVDAADYALVSVYTWYALSDRRGSIYAQAGNSQERSHLFMHRLVAGAKHGQLVDHMNWSGLDNRRLNLRVCTNSQNQANRRGLAKHNTSGYTGVSRQKGRRKWRAQIWHQNKHYFIGYFDSPEDAAIARDKLAVQLFGEYARLNEVQPA